MKKTTKQKKEKKIEMAVMPVEVNYSSSKLIRPVISFLGSFIIIVGFSLGIFWYGKQIYNSIQQLFRAPLIVKLNTTPSKISTTYYDPLSISEEINKEDSDVLFMDIRSKEEYTKAHIKKAISLPFYSLNNNKIDYFDIQQTARKAALDKSKLIVLYGPSTSFQQQHIVLSQLKKNGYSAQLLAVGWNELRHFQNIWIPEGLWGKIDVNSMIESNDGQ